MTIDAELQTTTDDTVTVGLLYSADEIVAQLTAQCSQLNRVVDELQKRLRAAGLDDLVPELLPRLIRYDE
jgi:hypothetical protein